MRKLALFAIAVSLALSMAAPTISFAGPDDAPSTSTTKTGGSNGGFDG